VRGRIVAGLSGAKYAYSPIFCGVVSPHAG
jgi:hypothetical protein